MQRSDAGVLPWHPLPAALPTPPEKSQSCSLAFCPFPAQETLAKSKFPWDPPLQLHHLKKKKKRWLKSCGSVVLLPQECTSPHLTVIALLSYPGTDILGPSPRLTFPLGLPRLVHSSQAVAISCWILHELGRYPGCGNGYLHSGKAPNHGLSLLTAVFQCLLSLCHDVASCFLTLSPSSSLCAPRGKCF